MKTDTQYLEPVGFKGTTGQWVWEERNKRFCIEALNQDGEETTAVEVAMTHGDENVDFENVKLLVKSKELAKALQDMIKMVEDDIGPLIDDGAQHEYENILWRSQNAKQVLKDAGLTDK